MQKLISAKDGSHIFYQIIGQGDPLFLIHGNSGSHDYFKKQIDFFKERYQLILMDTRDHGHSNNQQETLTFKDILSDVNVILNHENITKMVLLGFSDGANIALTYASYYQEKVSKMILVSPNISFDQLKPFQQFFSNKWHWTAKHLLRSKKLARVTQLAREDLPISTNNLRELKVPTLVVIGDHDIVTPEDTASFVKELPLGELVVINRCGHSVPRIHPQQLNQLSLDFLNKKEDDF